MFRYFVIGLSIAIGWAIGNLIVDEIGKIILNKIYGTKWHRRLRGIPNEKDESHDRKIGF